jgi:hemoglobin
MPVDPARACDARSVRSVRASLFPFARPSGVCDISVMAETTLFDRLGGFGAVSRIVLSFYDRVLMSERLEPFFAGVDMRRLVEHQAKFISSLMGGPTSYSDDELREVHGRLSIDRDSFQEMLALFRASLEQHGLPLSDIEAVMLELERRKPCIVTGGSRPDSRVA